LSAGTSPTELKGFEIGQDVWCIRADGAIAYGKITQFYPANAEGPAVSVLDEITGSHRIALLETVTLEPPKGGKGRLSRSQVQRVQKKK